MGGVALLGPADGDDGRSGSRVRGEHAVVPVAVHAGRGDEPGDALQELEGGEQDLGAPIGRGFGEAIEEPGLGRSEAGRAAQGVEALEGKGWPGTVADQALDARTVVALDADGGVDAEAAGALPGEHALGIGLVEKAACAEVPEHTALNDTLEVEPVVFVEQGGLVEADSPSGTCAKTPSRTTRWKWKWGLRDDPKRCRKETAPSWASGGAPGLAERSVVRMARRKICRTAPRRQGCGGGRGAGASGGTAPTGARVGAADWSVRWAATSAIRRVLHEGQMPRPLQEKAIRRSWPQSSHRARANPCARMPQRR